MVVGTGASGSMAADGVEERKQMSALIVDDNSVIQKIHKVIMTKLGFETQVVDNGKMAVDLHTSGCSFDVILMDMEMPVMNGIEATKELRAMGVETMIVGVTACSLESEKQAFKEAGLNECFVKPLNMEEAKSLVKKLNKEDN
ncbi:Signal transduction response regulator, receiver domain [Dillenia turbinata]|uniref:Signal transduction response regulator, receiver domain n=1 Tax=Dillenia turbinata TaxID=194707 RepID=A0AAN8UGX6_9MAGN